MCSTKQHIDHAQAKFLNEEYKMLWYGVLQIKLKVNISFVQEIMVAFYD